MGVREGVREIRWMERHMIGEEAQGRLERVGCAWPPAAKHQAPEDPPP